MAIDNKKPHRNLIFHVVIAGMLWGCLFNCRVFAQTTMSDPFKKYYKAEKRRVKIYNNPILPGDFQNTDVIRVGHTYYYISATKELSPGMLIMSSTDLVNWKLIGHAIPDITQLSSKYNYDQMTGQSRGVWAGCIRYHNNRFYIYFTDPDEGLFVTSAAKPAGPWAPLVALKKQAGWDDPCPLWDDNGKGYMVMTHFADNYKIYVFGLSKDGSHLTDSGRVIHQSEGSEANKIYKINNFYYHFYSEVTAEGRMPFMERARNIYGPYTTRRQLIHKAEAEPNQGGLINTPEGKWYFITHHGQSYWSGRDASLLPVSWVDGWPVWGKVGKDGIGNMIWRGKIPVDETYGMETGDDFNNKVLSPQWEWYFQPNPKKWSLTERAGFLRIYASKALSPGVMVKTPNILTQRPFRVNSNIVTVKLDISHITVGQVAGLSLFGKTFGCIGVMQTTGARNFYFNDNGKITNGTALVIKLTSVWLRSTWGKDGKALFYYSTDGITYLQLGNTYQITNFGNYLGAKIGLYTTNDEQDTGFIDVDRFDYQHH